MTRLLTIASALIFAGAFSIPAHATVIDFAAEAAGNERGVTSGTSFASPNFGGLTLQFDADNPARFPYFDDISSGLPAGLGLCKQLSGAAPAPCANTADDNITSGEGVTVSFLSGPFNVLTLSFRDEFHNSLDADNVGQLAIEINGGGAVTYTFMGAIAAAAAGSFLSVNSIRFAFVDTQFYVNSISDVPIPGALPLLLSGLAGLGFASRRRKKA